MQYTSLDASSEEIYKTIVRKTSNYPNGIGGSKTDNDKTNKSFTNFVFWLS